MTSVCDDVHRSTRKSEVKHSETGVQSILDAFRQFQNPFAMGSDRFDKLFCLSSGLPASKEVEADLLLYIDKGETAAAEFIESRLVGKTVKFHDPMKKLRLKTFASMAVKKELKSSEKKTIQVKAERNLLGRLVILSQDNDISLRKMFEYPLSPIPWSIATADGGMVKTSKSLLMHELETKAIPYACPPADKCIYIMDGNALIQSCINIPDTFGELALQIFNSLPKAPEIHFVTDCYKPHSIKSFERTRRGESGCYSIGGPKTRVPRENWKSSVLCRKQDSANKSASFRMAVRSLCEVFGSSQDTFRCW